MMIKRIVFIFTILLLQMPLQAQNLSEAEVSAIMTKAFQQNKEGKYKEALEGFLKVGQNTNKQRSEDERMVYVLSQTMAIMCFERLGLYQDGFTHSEKLLKEKLTEKEKEDVLHLYVMNGYFMATEYMQNKSQRYSEARNVFELILPHADKNMRSRILPKFPMSWYFEGMAYHMRQEYEKALRCAEKARRGYHELGQIKDEIDVTCQIAGIYNATFDTLGALGEYQKASLLAKGGKYDAKLMIILKEQRRLNNLVGNSEMMFQVAMQIDSLVTLTNDSSIKYEYYIYKGEEAKEHGYFDVAEQWYLKNEQYVQLLNEEKHGVNKHSYYTNLRDLYSKAGRYDEAIKYAVLSKQEFQKLNGPETTHYYLPYIALADIYSKKGDSIKCFAYIDSLFLAKNKMSEPKEIMLLFVTRARCHTVFKDYISALADYKEIDRLLSTKYPKSDGERISLLPLMGGLENRLKHYDVSVSLYKEYAEWMKTLHGKNSDDYINAIYYLANAEGFADQIDAACKHYSYAVDKIKTQIHEKLPFYTSIERESYWNSKADMLRNMTPFAVQSQKWQTSFTKDCYDGLVLSKSFLLESERSTYDVIKTNGTVEDLHDVAMISAMQAKIKELEKNYRQNADSILYLSSKAETREKRLASKCRRYGDMTAFMSIGYKEIKKKLKDEDVLIDFTDFVSESRGRVYAAYLVNSKQENPLLIKLFAESKIDSLQVNYPERYYENPYAETMRKLLWDPFKDKVKEGATVYYVPSQLLFQIALESLPMEDGSLLGEHYHFVRLSSARELVSFDLKLNIDMAANNHNAVLYGGLLYDLEANDWEVEAKKYDVSSLLAVRGDIIRGDSIFRLLPGSKKEVDAIGQILRTHRLKVELFTGKRGTEESFLSMSGKAPKILHVATHGFYYTPDEAQEIDYLRGYKDAMSLSGLVMSGGNAAWLGKELPDGVLGGILTASNIARLDLSNTELAVLSACESGKGKATAEGLYGLQRAFKKAGVKTMVMSLWNVSDRVGTEFMNIFYEKLLDKENRQDKRKAFEKAKMAIRKKYPDPYYWACFVMMD